MYRVMIWSHRIRVFENILHIFLYLIILWSQFTQTYTFAAKNSPTCIHINTCESQPCRCVRKTIFEYDMMQIIIIITCNRLNMTRWILIHILWLKILYTFVIQSSLMDLINEFLHETEIFKITHQLSHSRQLSLTCALFTIFHLHSERNVTFVLYLCLCTHPYNWIIIHYSQCIDTILRS